MKPRRSWKRRLLIGGAVAGIGAKLMSPYIGARFIHSRGPESTRNAAKRVVRVYEGAARKAKDFSKRHAGEIASAGAAAAATAWAIKSTKEQKARKKRKKKV